jgi:DNA-binding transcriptional MerR regulator
MVFVKQALPTRAQKSTRGFHLPNPNLLPHKQKRLNEPEIPVEAIKKLQEKHKQLQETNAHKRLIMEHSQRQQVAAELDRLRGNPGLIHGLVHQRVQNLSKQLKFNPRKHGSAFEVV